MQVTNFNSKAASLALAAVVSAITPVVAGYFNVSVEIGNDMVASVGGINKPHLEILTSRVWILDDDGNEINVDNAYIDTELIEASVTA
ncbi:MAG: hypothetical protein HDR88_10325 [Bacteroides sp.]|nr:hypothetical protein [Bacteroides sp.]